ncbi:MULTISPECIES: EcoAI/FtnUII family type I restriction enzme subunit R [Acinetobacter]|uniref:EcoAI/FtnUII family type I restriction enzme subunit R n=1 Tax=Acinetobacter TaxID=469 RepID=UPI00141B1538|nr:MULTISPECIES: DEAD/DEAH box helicase family protein [Acinetobacter]MCS4298360.1 type I restriction enzyme R subunit [Acinetobacter guillouiae]MCW2251964.1 type I restriction enzyme R subunit [Acinetobacter sp. BIGb0204]NII38617.1 type I restriction enzyme R subunit [Acinetobacter sp. BIGb0196]
MDKKKLSERDICSKFINPALEQAGWTAHQIREEVTFTNGQIMVRGKLHTRGERKRADYVLYYKKNIPLAIIEAKDNNHSIGAGMQQALAYADCLQVPFIFSSNGDGFLFHDQTGLFGEVEQELGLDEFPSPEYLWKLYEQHKGLTTPESKQIVEYPYYDDGSGRSPRYYQVNAINKTIEAIARRQNRILLVMATGTGKTYTAFQIIWRLWKAGAKKRILFLADRNILVDQTKNKDFKPFGQHMTKISNRMIDKSYEIYLSLYQAVTGSEEEKNIYKQFSPEFFDLIVIDECHRGSAKEDSAWREILEYFSSATHVGLTATPKETKDASNITYFGDSVYTYTLKQGIQDGFLAPYKVVRIDIDKDLQGWRPEKGKKDDRGNEITDRIYNLKDMDKGLVLKKRTELVARKITEFLINTDPYAKTIVFCDDIDHAERMRQALVNLNPERVKENRKFVMRITGDDKDGKAELDNFINPEERYPVIATTSKLMTTGVDSETCKLIVLDQHIKSMTEFKQMIGRGTRINEEFGKTWFTIMDFKKATELFSDPAFDGEPVVIYEPKPDEPVVPPDEPDIEDESDDTDYPDDDSITGGTSGGNDTGGGDGEPPRKFYVNDVAVNVIGERVQFYDNEGKLVTESLKDYTRQHILKDYESLDAFLRKWKGADKKSLIIDEFKKQGVIFEALEDEVGKDFDPFDMICHIAFDQPALTKKERVNNVRKRNYFTKYNDQARQVLDALLDKYADQGIEPIEDVKILKIPPFNQMGSIIEIIQSFGSVEAYTNALKELGDHLYDDAS